MWVMLFASFTGIPTFLTWFAQRQHGCESSNNWAVMNMSECQTQPAAFSNVVLDQSAEITVQGSVDFRSASHSSGARPLLLIISMDAPELCANSLPSWPIPVRDNSSIFVCCEERIPVFLVRPAACKYLCAVSMMHFAILSSQC